MTITGEQGPRMIHIPDYRSTLAMDVIKPRYMYEMDKSPERPWLDRVMGVYCIDPTTCSEFEFLAWLEYGSIEDLEQFGRDSKASFFHYRKEEEVTHLHDCRNA
jgi:hypothetical protein